MDGLFSFVMFERDKLESRGLVVLGGFRMLGFCFGLYVGGVGSKVRF